MTPGQEVGYYCIWKDTQSLSKKGDDVKAIGTAFCRVPLSQLCPAFPSVGSAEASPPSTCSGHHRGRPGTGRGVARPNREPTTGLLPEAHGSTVTCFVGLALWVAIHPPPTKKKKRRQNPNPHTRNVTLFGNRVPAKASK